MIRHTRTLLLLSFLATLPSPRSHAEDAARTLDKGRVELSTAASFSVTKMNGDDDTITVFELPLRVGYFLTRRAELEGELLFTHASSDGGDNANNGVQGSGRLLWHFGSGRTAPFVYAGGGLGNGVPIAGLVLELEDETVTHAEAGAGIKAFLGEHAALRTEYRFRRYFRDEQRDRFGFGERPGGDEHRLFVGLSVFLR